MQAFPNGAVLVLDPALDMPRQALLDWVDAIAGSILPDDAPLVQATAMDPAQGAFIFVSQGPPAGSDPRVRLDDGAIEIVDSAGTALFDAPALDRVGHVEIVTIDGVEVPWIRPGTGPAPTPTDRAPLILDHGDLALIDESGLLVANSGERLELAAITYGDRSSAAQILSAYRPWIIGGMWAVLTLLVLGFLKRRHRGRGAPDARDSRPMALDRESEALGSLLLDRGRLTADQLDQATRLPIDWNVPLAKVRTARRWVSSADLHAEIARC